MLREIVSIDVTQSLKTTVKHQTAYKEFEKQNKIHRWSFWLRAAQQWTVRPGFKNIYLLMPSINTNAVQLDIQGKNTA